MAQCHRCKGAIYSLIDEAQGLACQHDCHLPKEVAR
jgi:hypothetical protein